VKDRNKSVCLVVVFAALAACGKDPQAERAKQANSVRAIERRLAEIAGQANGAAPAAVDPNTRLDGAKAGPGLKLTTTYTLLNPESEGITDSTTFETKLTPVVKEGSCQNPDLRPLIDRGVVVVLEYRHTDGSPIGTVSVDRAACAAPQKPATKP
jgi:hypothetical protein